MAYIDLSKPRVIVVDERNRKFTYTVARIKDAQWCKYFEGIVSLSEYQGGKRVDSFDASAARLELVESSLVDGQGWHEKITDIEGWKSKLPLSHRLAIASCLVNVTPSSSDVDALPKLGTETVWIDAVWSADEHGRMQKYHALSHFFQTPTAAHQTRYSRAMSRSRIIGGSRNAKTQWLGGQVTLIELYDELVLGCEGYQVGDEILGDQKERIVANMDAYHKVAAIEQLFAPAEVQIGEE